METLVRVKHLQKSFDDLKAVDDLSFEVRKGEIFGLLGPNGAGKTTTISMVCGLLPPGGGDISFSLEKDPRSLIGYCPQENIYYPKLSCYEQLMFTGQMHGISLRHLKKHALSLLDLLGLEAKTHVLASNLSGGMKRRLNICLALMHDPEILILDEPEAGLDPQSRILVRDFIREFGNEKAVILTTHNMDEADRLADRVMIIDHGKPLLLDTPKNLKKSIGEGDLLEIVPESQQEEPIRKFTNDLESLSMKVISGEGALLIKHPDLISKIGSIVQLAGGAGLNIAEIRLRENTLEDVFIHLTGRRLRT